MFSLLIGIIFVILTIYLVGGTVIGVSHYVNDRWPVYCDEGGLPYLIDAGKTIPFFFACGPLFWIILIFIWGFARIWHMLD
jgi:hypothetical protein